MWNGFSILGKNKELLEKMLVDVETTLTEIASKSNSSGNFF